MTIDHPVLPGPHRDDGPRWRVAVLHADGTRARRTTDAVVVQLRAAGYMAVEHDPASIDPFLDIDTQWAAAAHADAYDLVLSIGALLPAAVALASVCDAPLARLRASPPDHLPGRVHETLTEARIRTVPTLDVAADGSRHITTAGIDVTSHDPVVATIRHDDRLGSLHGDGWSISPLGAPPGQLAVTPASGREVIAADEVRVESPGGALRLDIDGRSRRVRTIAVRCRPHGLRLLELPTAGAPSDRAE